MGGMDLSADLGRMLVCSGGLPGSGKTTLNRALSRRLVGSEVVISEELRRAHALDDAFSADHRRRLHPLLAAEVQAAARISDVVIVDSNLLERRARAAICDAVAPGRLRAFIAPHAPLETVIDRVSKKFGKGYLYPLGAYEPVEIINHGIYSGEPVDVEEAMGAFDVVVQINTVDHRVNWWVRDGSKAEAGRAFAGLIANASAEIGGVRAPDPTALSLGSHDERWIWDPERMGLVVALPALTQRTLTP
jgi:predicted kinase